MKHTHKTIFPVGAKKTFLALVPLLVILVLAGIFLLPQSSAAAPNCTGGTFSPGINLQQTLNSATAGSTICLNAGTYSGWSASITKSAMTTVTAASGVSASQVIIGNIDSAKAPDWASQNITFDGITLGGIDMGTATAHHMHIINSILTGPVSIHTPDSTNMDILLDNDTFGAIGTGCDEGRVSICGGNIHHTAANGITIQNSLFTTHGKEGDCSDGVQINGEAYGTQILHNEFSNMVQGSCSAHADGIQFYGAVHTLIDGNYFHAMSTPIMTPDGDSTYTITNNVFDKTGGDGYQWAIVDGGGSDDVISHNTFAHGYYPLFGPDHSGNFGTNETLQNNVLTGNVDWATYSGGAAQVPVNDHNLCSSSGSSCGGNGQNIIGNPVFVGGTNPTTYAGFALAAGSPGKGGASDHTDIGINVSGGTTTPPPPPPATYDLADLNNLKAHYGSTTGMTTADGDLNGDGAVNIFDLGIFLSYYNS